MINVNLLDHRFLFGDEKGLGSIIVAREIKRV